ncbi:MAG: glycosyltransferase family A protein [Pseudomonadota bacterium]
MTAATALPTPAQDRGPRIFYLYPELQNDEQFADDFYRAMFYLYPVAKPGDRILIASTHGKSPFAHQPADFLDRNVAKMADALRPLIEVHTPEEAKTRFETFPGKHFICLWDDRLRQHDPFLKRLNGHAVLVRSDHRRVQTASSHYLRVSSDDGRGTEHQRGSAKKRLRSLLRDLRQERMVLFGTGPMLETIDIASLPPGARIATNSMVKNAPLMEALKPRAIVAADPIFHAGASIYAEEFRALLVTAMRRYGSAFVFPMRDIAVYETLLPADVHDRLIGVLTQPHGTLGFDLMESCRVTATKNVMTHFLLPLAANLSSETYLAGFDGRKVAESSYFWGHAPTSQIVDRMPDIRRANPAFFDIDYNDYYREHCRTVASYLDAMEAKGQKVVSLTPSLVPAIRGRYLAGVQSLGWTAALARPEVSVVLNAGGASDGVLVPSDDLASLQETVASLQAQSCEDWEALCVAPTPGPCRDWLNEEVKRDSRLLLLDEQDDGCVAAALNSGLDYARGNFVTFLAAGDRLIPKALERRLRYLQANKNVSLCGGRAALLDQDGQSLNVELGRPTAAQLHHARSSIFPLSTLFGKAVVMKRFRFEATLQAAPAWEFVVRAMEVSYAIGSTGPEPLVFTRRSQLGARFTEPFLRYQSVAHLLNDVAKPTDESLLFGDKTDRPYPRQVERAKLRALQSLLVAQVLLKDKAGLAEVLSFFEAIVEDPRMQPLDAGFFEPLAAEVLIKPQGSRALAQAVSQRYDAIFALYDQLQLYPQQRDFAIAFCWFTMKMAKRAGEGRGWGEAERRIARQVLGQAWRVQALQVRGLAAGAYRPLRDGLVKGARQAWEAQRNLRRARRRRLRRRKEAKLLDHGGS